MSHPFGDVIDFQEGPGIMAVDFRAQGVPLIRLAGLSSTESVLEGCNYLDPQMVQRKWQHFRLLQGDTLLSTSAALGRVAVVDAAGEGAVAYTGLIRMRPRSELVDSSFIPYALLAPEFQRQAEAVGVGSVMRHFGPSHLRNMSLTLPPLPTQRKIASILSAYDDLIANNNKRIHLLEEMAQRIYREWFVDFRYPGHENVQLVDSELGPIPQGWVAARMDAIADVVDCLHSKKPNPTQDGPGILLQLFNVGEAGVVDLTQLYRITSADYQQWTSRIEVQAGDCVITNVGRIAAVGQIPPGLFAAPGRNMTVVRPRAISPTYLIQYLLSEHMEREVHRKKDAGSIMDALNVKGIVRLAVPVPPDDLGVRFEQTCRPIRRAMELIEVAQRNLRHTRDLLLPRLISGEVDVDDLDISMPEEAA